MMLHVLSAGDGYLYYTDQVATGDRKRDKKRGLTDYYTVEGNPPGRWMGGGLKHLGVSGEVIEAQMKALFGEGLHPDADRIIAERLAAGDTPQEAQNAARLGRKYYAYQQKDNALVREIREGLDSFERRFHRAPTADERRQIRARVGAVAFQKAKGRQPSSKEELGRFITAATKPAQQAVAGFDHVLSPAKSVSVLWALGSNRDRRLIKQAQDEALESTIGFLQREGIATRAGTNGVAQIDVDGGFNATMFRHYTSRTGDPQLHDHLVVSNLVKGVDGKWRTIDSKLLHRMTVAASEHYNHEVLARISSKMGVEVEARQVTAGKRPVMEIAGVDQRLIDAFSARSQQIKKLITKLEREYRNEHGRAPGAKARMQLAQQATLQTRPDKPKAQPLSEVLAGFKQRAAGIIGDHKVSHHTARVQQTGDRLRHTKRREQQAAERDGVPAAEVDQSAVAAEIVATVSEHHAVFGWNHVLAEAERWVMVNRFGDERRVELAHAIASTAITGNVVAITPPQPHRFEPLTRADGHSFYAHKGSDLYTSHTLLTAEDTLLAAATTHTHAPVSAASFAKTLAAFDGQLDAGQQLLAQEFVTSPQVLKVGIGPAGAGKTTAMRLAVQAATDAGGKVVGLAPSSAAARVMRAELGIKATTIHGYLGARKRGSGPALGPGDILLIDEAGMAGTENLARLVDDAEWRGAHVRLLGDDRQLDAVEAGGALRLLDNRTDSVHLEELHRFRNAEEAAASLLLRDPTLEGDRFAWYLENGRIFGGSKEVLEQLAFEHWQTDTAAGMTTLMQASSNEQMAALNEKAQAHRILTGHVTGRKKTILRDGTYAHTGDTVITRENNALLRYNRGRDRVENGDLWPVKKPNRDGSLLVEHATSGHTLLLPADYVQQHVHLGYAATVNRGQGSTSDIGRAFASSMTSRNNVYAALTRGKFGNYLYVETGDGQDVRDVLAQIADNYDHVLSAHETIEHEQSRVDDLPTLVDQYADVATRADTFRLTAIATKALGETRVVELAKNESWDAVLAGIAHAGRIGMDPVTVLAAAHAEREFGTAEDEAAVLSWRLERRIEQFKKDHPDRVDAATTEADTHPIPAWIADRKALGSTHTPDTWRAHLQERYDYLTLRLHEYGTGIAADQPAWATQLGPVPDHGARRDAWTRLAAEISVFRSKYGIDPTTPDAIPEEKQTKPLGKALSGRVTAMHKAAMLATATATTATTTTPERLTAEHHRAETAAQSATEHRRTAVLTAEATPQRSGDAVVDADHTHASPAPSQAAVEGAQPTETPMMRAARTATVDAAARSIDTDAGPAATAAGQVAAAAEAGRAQRTATAAVAEIASQRTREERSALTAAGIDHTIRTPERISDTGIRESDTPAAATHGKRAAEHDAPAAVTEDAQPAETPMMRAARIATQQAIARPQEGTRMPTTSTEIAEQHAAVARAVRLQQAAARKAQQAAHDAAAADLRLATTRTDQERALLAAAGIDPDTVHDLPERLDGAPARHDDEHTREQDTGREL